MKSAAISVALVAIVIPLVEAMAESLSPTKVFDGNTTTPIKGGATQAVHLSVQSWGIAGERGGKGTAQEIPLQGFYVAHLLSGDISTTIAGQTTQHLPGDYWTIKSGATMQVKVLGEYAMLETIVVSKE
jgi:quercetin dioxygenase-like cupin family protein